jgi:hypothetical protein
MREWFTGGFMKKFRWQIAFGLLLTFVSLLIYLLHYVIFRDSYHIFKYGLHELAFVPIEVLVVTLIIDQLLKVREKRSMLNKMNMVIGTFFTEVGAGLLRRLAGFDGSVDKLKDHLLISNKWPDKKFSAVAKELEHFNHDVRCKNGDLPGLKLFLEEKRPGLAGLLSNPNLLEHESFTDLLWATTHIAEELAYRHDLTNLSHTDYAHLSVDIRRAYVLLIGEWLLYMRHLKNRYPHLFSLALRTNPFDPNATPEIPEIKEGA